LLRSIADSSVHANEPLLSYPIKKLYILVLSNTELSILSDILIYSHIRRAVLLTPDGSEKASTPSITTEVTVEVLVSISV